MLIASLVLTGMLLLGSTVALFRVSEAASWRRSLVAFRLTLPQTLTIEGVARWLAGVNAATHADHWSPLPVLLPAHPIALEEGAVKGVIKYYLLVPKDSQQAIEAGLRSSLPGVGLEAAPEHLAHRPRFTLNAEGTLSNHRRPLNEDLAAAASTARVSAFQPLHGTEEVWVQWIFTGGGIPGAVPSVSVSRKRRDAWLPESTGPDDPEAVHAARVKKHAPLLRAVVRVGVANTTSRERRNTLFGVVWGPLRAMNATGVGVVRRWWLPSLIVADRMQRRTLPVLWRWPLTLNTTELAGLLGLVTDIRLPGLTLADSRPVPPPPDMPTGGADAVVVAFSDYAGMEDRPLALRTPDRLMHMHVIGPTGTGKSTFFGGLALQDIEAGRPVVMIDPKNDLVEAMLDRYPPSRDDDLIVLDASETSRPIGFNPLAVGDNEHDREMAVDRVLHVMREIYADFWGPRTDHVLRGALLTLVYARAPDSSALTLCEVAPLLTNPAFRRAIRRQPLPERLRPFWDWYEGLKPSEQVTVIGPVINKLGAFTDRSAIRLMLGQSNGLDLSAVLGSGQVLLVNLARGRLGPETAALIGAVFVASLQQAFQQRAYMPAAARRPAMVYIDEFQDVLKTGAVGDMLDQVRGFGGALHLAHQYVHQLPRHDAHGVLGTVRTQVMFQQREEDARFLAKGVEPYLTAADLQNLGARRIVLRPCVNGRTEPPVTGTTLPLPEPTRDGAALAQASRERYGVPRREVEATIQARTRTAATAYSFGRAPREVMS